MTKTQQVKKQEPGNRGLRSILVPIDFSAASERAFHHALDLARQYRSRVILLHVVTALEFQNGSETAKSAKKSLAAHCKAAGAWAKRCKLIMRSGTPFSEITQSAEKEGADLIVIGRSDSTVTGTFGNGHTADRVLRYAKCPVLIVNETGRDFVAMPDAA